MSLYARDEDNELPGPRQGVEYEPHDEVIELTGIAHGYPAQVRALRKCIEHRPGMPPSPVRFDIRADGCPLLIATDLTEEEKRAARRYLTPGWVYLIEAKEIRRLKIGFTTKSPESRLKGLQTGSPAALSVVAQVKSLSGLELRLHKKFARYRVVGEWFKDRAPIRREFERLAR
jgi:hypothetical protein